MTKYNKQGVPNLSFHNPMGIALYPEGLYTYAMGNTPARDITELLGTSAEQHVDVLLLACGDVRNFLCSLSELSLRKPRERPKSLSFHLNDYDPSVTARDAVLLEIASVINPDVPADVDFLWNICDESILKFQDGGVLRECRDIWKDWRDLDLEVKSVKEERKNLIVGRKRSVKYSEDSQCLSILSHMTMVIYEEELENFLEPAATNPLYTEIQHWYREGSTNEESEKTNPALIRPFVHKWRQHYASCAFEGYPPLERKRSVKYSEDSQCLSILTHMVMVIYEEELENFLEPAATNALYTEIQHWYREDSANEESEKTNPTLIRPFVHKWRQHYASCAFEGYPPLERKTTKDVKQVGWVFSRTTTTVTAANASDGPRTKANLREIYVNSLAIPSVYVVDNNTTSMNNGIDDLAVRVLGGLFTNVSFNNSPVNIYINFQSNAHPNDSSNGSHLCDPLRMYFSCFVDMNSSKFQISCKVGKIFYNISKRRDGTVGELVIKSLAPLPFHAMPEWKGKLTDLRPNASLLFTSSMLWDAECDSIEEYYNKCVGVPLQLLPTLLGLKLAVDLELGSKKLPDKDDSTEETLCWVKADTKRNLLTIATKMFDLLENELPADFKRKYGLSWNLIKASLGKKPVSFGNETVKSVKRIDPVETFGLSARQTFTVVESDEKCQVLKVIKMEENAHSYSGELEILDSSICKAKEMKISQPDKSPTGV
ncbi:hypothetical protein AWC38_SpisGene18026 [Stylophora pistillata]|uniref:DUF4470 domain-containing protein n=1 Tax=Stylophora pistillata TaxID=50429 RepID=A0A2B4RLF1_STYPI|nr:hypothetical protein AWC38_SpisGene18026 [Stylophora pistillata]